jgi:hypothetical protein
MFGKTDKSPVPAGAYTPTLSSSTNATASCTYAEFGAGMMWVSGVISWSGAGGAGTFTVSLPPGRTFKTSGLAGGTAADTGATVMGGGTWYDDGVQEKIIFVDYASTTAVKFYVASLLDGSFFAANDRLRFFFIAPVN